MSYISNKNNDLFIKSKVTQKGREKIAKGKFNFTTWAIGDSEINYNNINSITAKTINVVDNQASIKYYLYDGNNVLNNITEDNINVDKVVLYNEKNDIGYFSGNTNILEKPFIVYSGVANKSLLSGTTGLTITNTGSTIGDYILIKLNDEINNQTPTINIWYKIINTGSTLMLDRELPNLSGETGQFSYIIYKNDEINNIFIQPTVNFTWDNNLLEFVPENESLILSGSPVWNMNIVYNENYCGFNSGWTGFSGFSSQNYLGTKDPYLNPFDIDNNNNTITSINCGVVKSTNDINKTAAIIHYTNNDYYNGYGEFIYVDSNNKLEMNIPNLLYHNRYFSGSTYSGMKFVSNSILKTLSGTNITYYDILEEESLIKPNTTPRTIGKLFHNFNIILITDDEIVTALSYKANRNYTLPELEGELEDSNDGLLEPQQTIYLTYELSNNLNYGVKNGLPCQNYVKIYNNSTKTKNINFWFKDNNPFNFLVSGDTGNGFRANEFNLLYQIVENYGDRPLYNNWKKINVINGANYIDKSQLNGGYFSMNKNDVNTSTNFTLNNSFNNNSGLNYGEEKMFYGNIKAFAGSTIFKTNFNFTIDSSKFNHSTNPTYKNSDSIKMTELNIYDSEGDLMIISKTSKPIEIGEINNVTLKVDIDF